VGPLPGQKDNRPLEECIRDLTGFRSMRPVNWAGATVRFAVECVEQTSRGNLMTGHLTFAIEYACDPFETLMNE